MRTREQILKCMIAMFVVALFGLSTNVLAATQVIMSNDTNALGLKGQSFDLLKAEIEKRLGTDVKVEVHHGGALFNQKTQIQGLQLGSAHLIAPTFGIYTPVAPNISAFALPFLLTSPEKIERAINDPLVRATFGPQLESKKIIPAAIWINGPRDISYRGSKPVLVQEDMKGIKIRVQNVPSDIAAMKAVGANVISMSWGEVPTAIQQGVIDAVEPTPNSLAGAGLIESIDQLTRINYRYSFYIVGANKQWWDGLSDKELKAVKEALDVATKWNWENAAAKNKEAYGKVTSAGKAIHDLTPEQIEQWVKAMKPVWEEFGEKLVGPEAMARLEEIGAGK